MRVRDRVLRRSQVSFSGVWSPMATNNERPCLRNKVESRNWHLCVFFSNSPTHIQEGDYIWSQDMQWLLVWERHRPGPVISHIRSKMLNLKKRQDIVLGIRFIRTPSVVDDITGWRTGNHPIYDLQSLNAIAWRASSQTSPSRGLMQRPHCDSGLEQQGSSAPSVSMTS